MRPTISITKAHLKLNDFDEAVRAGTLEVDGKVVVHTPTDWIKQNREATEQGRTSRAEDDEAAQESKSGRSDAGVELNTSKIAFEPVWYLPGENSFRDRLLSLLPADSPFDLRYCGTVQRQRGNPEAMPL